MDGQAKEDHSNDSKEAYSAFVAEVIAARSAAVDVDDKILTCARGIAIAKRAFPEAIKRAQNVLEVLPVPFKQVSDLENIFVGSLPTGVPTASIRPVGSGYLLLTESGIEDLIAFVAETVVSLCIIRHLPERIEFGFDPNGVLITVDQARVGLERAFSEFRSGNRVNVNSLALSGVHAGFAYFTCHQAIQFVYLHELAHVILGHCAGQMPYLEGYEPDPSESVASFKEYQADTLALIMGMSVLPEDIRGLTRQGHFLAGAELVCWVMALIELFGIRDVSDPPALSRLQQIRSQHGQPWVPPQIAAVSELFNNVFEGLFPGLQR
jgi:hypothetical protein